MLRGMIVAAAILILASGAYAQSANIGFGAHGGFISSFNHKNLEESIKDAYQRLGNFDLSGQMQTLGVNFDLSLIPNLGFDASLDYSWKTQQIFGDIKLRHQIVSLTGFAILSFPGIVSPYIGAGIGAYRTAQSISNDTLAVVLPSDHTDFGLVGKIGVSVKAPMFPLMPYAEWRYNDVRTSGDGIKFQMFLIGVNLKI